MKVTKKITAITLVTALSVTMICGCGRKTASNEGYVQVYETTGTKSKLMSRESDLTFDAVDDTSVNAKITIDEEDVRQEIEGFGGALTHSAAYVLYQMEIRYSHRAW